MHTKAGLDFSRHKKEGIDPGKAGFFPPKRRLYHQSGSDSFDATRPLFVKTALPSLNAKTDSCSRHSGPEVGDLILGGAARPELGDLCRLVPEDECG